jgi:hypothetical protein
MPGKGLRLLGAALLTALVWLAPSELKAQARRVPCSEVLSRLDRVVSRRGPAAADPIKLGQSIGVDPRWIERCAQVYGRRLSREPRRAGVSREEQDIIWESQEADEYAREEFETRDEDYFDEIPNDKQDRGRLRRFKPSTTTSNEWEPFVTHEWSPNTGHEWQPFLLDK